MKTGWIVPTLIYVVLMGSLGITSKLALRHMNWESLVLWAAAVYMVVGLVLLATGTHLKFGAGAPMAAASGLIAAVALVLFYVALRRGEVTRVVPITSSYPIVTAALGVGFLAERLTVARAIGTILVVVGVVTITAAP